MKVKPTNVGLVARVRFMEAGFDFSLLQSRARGSGGATCLMMGFKNVFRAYIGQY